MNANSNVGPTRSFQARLNQWIITVVAILLVGNLVASTRAVSTLRIVSTTVAQAGSGTFTVGFDAQGNEGGLAFSLSYDPNLITITGAVAARSGDTLILTPSEERQGRYGIQWSVSTLFSGIPIPAGSYSLVTVSFTAANVDGQLATVAFGDLPITKAVSDVTAGSLTSQLQVQSGTVTIGTIKATPVITWATPAAIDYGTALSATQLNATSDQAGTIAYNQAVGALLGAGTHTLTATFTPTDPNTVKSGTKDVTLTVNKVPLSIGTTSPSIRVGDALPTVAPSYTGFVNGETPANLTTPATAVHTAQNSNTAGTFPITVSGATSSNYTISHANGTLTIAEKITPVITWSTPVAVSYGTALSATQLNATSDQPGTITYNQTVGTVLGAGSHTLTATFVPTDAANVKTATKDVTLVVNQVPLTITADDKTIKTGLPLPQLTISYSGFVNGETSTALTAQPTVTTSAQNTSTLGNFPITVSGATSANYAIIYVSGTLHVIDKTVPVITWAPPAAINYGTALSATQLNATANTPGVFTYTPPVGTILNGGALQTLSVAFAPDLTTEFAPTTATVTIDVNKLPLTITAENKTKLFGAPLPAFTATSAGFLSGQSVADLTSPVVLTTDATRNSLAGTYTITPSGATSPNYNITFVPATLAISAPSLTITPVPNATIESGESVVSGITVGDGDVPLSSITVTGTSSNTALVPNNNIIVAGTGAGRVVNVKTVPGLTGSAIITLTVSNGNHSITTTFTVTVNPPNLPPVLAGIETTALAYTENDAAKVVSSTLTITDSDSSNLAGAWVYFVPPFFPGADDLQFTASGGITGAFHAARGELELVGTAPVASYQTVLRSVTYSNLSENPSSLPRQIAFQVIDALGQHRHSNELIRQVVVTPVNDIPSITEIPDQTIIENSLGLEQIFTVRDFESEGGGVLYDNTQHPLGQIYAAGNGVEFGDQIYFGGNERTIADFEFRAFLSANASGNETIQLFLRKNDDGEGALPGTVLYSSNPVLLKPGYQLISEPDLLLSSLPPSITWSVIINGIDSGEEAGLELFGPATVGASLDDFWVRNLDGTWSNFSLGNGAAAPANFAARVVGVLPLTVSAVSDNPTLVPNSPSNIVFKGDGNNRTIKLVPAPDQKGTANVTVTVDDGHGGTASDTFVLTVNQFNRPPTIGAVTAQTTLEDSGPQNVAIGGIAPGPPDEAQQTLTFTAVSSNPAIVPNPIVQHVAGSATAVLTYAPIPNANGTVTITLTVQDNGGVANGGTDAASVTFDVTVTPVNDPPTLATIPAQTVAEDSGVHTITLTGISPGPLNESNQGLGFTAISSNEAIVPNPTVSVNSTTQVVTLGFTPAPNANGAVSITVLVVDSGGVTSGGVDTFSTSFDLVVTPVNDPPAFAPIPDQSVNEQNLLTVNISATDPETGTTGITYSLGTGAPFGAAIDSATGQFTWTPTEAQGPAVTTITVLATDNATPPLTGSTTFVVNVNEINVGPVVNAVSDQTIAEGNTLSFSVSASDSDLPANSVSFSLGSGAPAGASISSGGTFSWTPTESDGPGTYSISVSVSDGAFSAIGSFSVTVTEVNNAPILASIGNRSVDEGGTLSFSASATDSDLPAQSFTYSLGAGAPVGASIDASSGVFSWTPTEAQGPGTFPITILVADSGPGNPTASQSFSVTVNEVNQAPVLAGVSDQGVAEETEMTVPTAVADGDLPPNRLTYSLVSPPAGATIDSSTGVFKWNPTEVQGPATVSVTVQVTDDGPGNLSATRTFSVRVFEVNAAPTLAPVSDQSIEAGTPLVVNLSGTDPDLPANALTYSLTSGPTGAQVNPTTGQFSWTPPTTAGDTTANVTVQVSDNGSPALTASQTFKVAVSVSNKVPTFAVVADQTVDEGRPLSFSVLATDSDVPAQTLTYSLAPGAPAGASIDPGTGQISWTPTEAQGPAVVSITVRAVDNGTPALTASTTVSITVNEVNSVPTLTPVPRQQILAGSPLTVPLSAADPDLPANTLRFSLGTAAPAGSSIDPSTGVFSWTPDPASPPATRLVNVLVTDNGTPALSATQSFEVVVEALNRTPVIAAIGSRTVDEGLAFSLQINATDPDVPTQKLTYEIVSGAPPRMVIDPATGIISWTPTEQDGPATHQIVVQVSDDGVPAATARQEFALVVNEVNTAPVLDQILNQTLVVGSPLSLSVTAKDSDLPANTLTYSLTQAPASATIDPATGLVSWTPTAAEGLSTVSFTVVVADNGTPSLNATQSFTVSVASSNTPPTLAPLGRRTVREGELLSFTIQGADADLPAQPLVYEMVSGAPEGAVLDRVSGVFTWTPTEAQGPGTVLIGVRVSDSVTPPLSVTRDLTVVVTEVNLPPTISPVDPATVNEGELVTVTVVATDPDLPANSLVFTLGANAPEGAAIDRTSGVFTWTPNRAQGPLTYDIPIVVTDNRTPALSAQTLFKVVVNEVNTPPVLAAIAAQTVDEGTPLSFVAAGSDTDLPAQTLRYSLGLGVPPGASIDATTGEFRWTPTEAQGPGTFVVSVRVTDSGVPIGRAAQDVTIVVNEINTAPVVSPIPDVTVSLGNTVTVQIAAKDADLPANTLQYALVSGPTGAVVDPATGVLTWAPSAAQAASSSVITVSVTDNGPGNLSATTSFTATVGENLPPTMSPISNQTAPENGAVPLIAFTITDPDTVLTAYQYTVTSSNPDLVPAANIVVGGTGSNRTLSIKPLPDVSGTSTITLTAKEPAGGQAVTAFDLRVAPLPPGIVRQPADQQAVAGSEVTFSVLATGSKPLTYQWKRDNVDIPGAGNSVLLLKNVKPSEAGTYSVVVGNTLASVTSRDAVLAVVVPLRITSQPLSQKVLAGGNVTLAVVAEGSGQLTYQWSANGVDIPNATGANLVLNAVDPIVAGSYVVTVSSAGVSVKSQPAQLDVIAPVVITGQPQPQTVAAGGAADFTVVATGSQPIRYQWQFQGRDISGETAPTLALTNLKPQDSGNYSVVVSNAGGSVRSGAAELVVAAPPVIKRQPQPKQVLAGGDASFSVTVSGTPPLAYQWSLNGTAIPGATSATLALTGVTPAQGGDYTVDVSNPGGAVTSVPATLAVNEPVVITAQPQRQTVAAGGTASFSVTATGSAPLTYQWKFRGVDMPGETNPTLTVANVNAASHAGAYRVVVSNPAGPVTSAVAPLTVNVGVNIVQQPQSLSVTNGSNVGFTVVATGTAPLTYQWRFNGTDIVGATSASLAVGNVQPANAGAYSVVVQNLVDAATSADAVLGVIIPPSIQTQPVSQNVDLGASVNFSVVASGDAPLSFQWQLNGGTIAGATAATYSIPNAQPRDAGSYTVVVTNPGGSATSSTATLSLILPQLATGNTANNVPAPIVAPQGTFGGNNSGNGAASARRNAPPSTATDRWFAWQAPGSGIVTFSTAGSTFDTVLAAYTGTAPNLTQIARDDDRGGFLASEIQFNAVQGTSYLINVQGFGGASGEFIVSFTLNATQARLPVLSSSPTSVSAIVGAAVNFSVVASGTDLSYQWLRNGTAIAGATGASLALQNVQETDALSYTVRVTSGTTGTPVSVESLPALLHVGTVDSLSEDKFLNAPRLSGGVVLQSVVIRPPSVQAGGSVARGFTGSQVFNTFGASKEPGEPNHCDVVGGASQWFTYVAPETGVVRVSTEGSSFDTVLAVYSGPGTSFADLVLVACDNNSGTDGVTSVATLQVTKDTTYFVAVDGVGGASGTVKLGYEFAQGPAIAAQPKSVSVRQGEQVVFTVALADPVAGAVPVVSTYQWTKNGLAIAGQTANNLAFVSATLTDAGDYAVIVSNFAGSTTSETVRLDVSVPLSISAQPVDQALTVGAALNLSVAASGTDPITYQWQLNGSDIAGATAASYSVASAQSADAGAYTVVVTNPVGSVTSATATVTLDSTPTITVQPVGVAATVGDQVNLAVTATGTGTLSYQWRLNGVDVAGATAETLVLDNVDPASAGNYTVVVGNTAGAVISQVAAVSVNVPLALVEEPQSQTLPAGSTAIFNVRASGSGPFAYQWRLNSQDIPGAVSSSLAVTDVQAINQGGYAVVVTSGAQSVTSAEAVLSVSSLPIITVQPLGQVVYAGANVTLSVVAGGTGPLQYQWLLDGTSLEGATSPELILPGVGVGAAGSYSVIVSNGAGTAASELAILTVREVVSNLSQNLTGFDQGLNAFRFRVSVPEGRQALVQVSTDFVDWVDLTPAPVTGVLDVEDPDASGLALRFYRVLDAGPAQ
ncbi:MAG: immunoglobulin domain-containing protein [Verrucomicrobia bacterium]|nr:immunoglobulin domain-containing protein [Verrucomicrobiota bacterium]